VNETGLKVAGELSFVISSVLLEASVPSS